MTDLHSQSSATPMGRNVRRFVRSAWLLLIAQLLSAILAIGVTAWAAFYVAELRAERDALRAQVEEFIGRDVTVPDPVAPRDAPPGDPIEPIASAEEPVPVEPPIEQSPAPEIDTPPPPARSPRPPRRLLETNPRPATPTIQRPVERTPATQTDTPEREPERQTQAPRRPNRVYPGGLPGDGDNIEPPFVRDPVRTERPAGRVPTPPRIPADLVQDVLGDRPTTNQNRNTSTADPIEIDDRHQTVMRNR